jgi:hypothetical protein
MGKAYGQAGYDRARAAFSVAAMADKTIKVYGAALGRAPVQSLTTASAQESTE